MAGTSLGRVAFFLMDHDCFLPIFVSFCGVKKIHWFRFMREGALVIGGLLLDFVREVMEEDGFCFCNVVYGRIEGGENDSGKCYEKLFFGFRYV